VAEGRHVTLQLGLEGETEARGHDEIARPRVLGGVEHARVEVGGEEHRLGKLAAESAQHEGLVVDIAAQHADGPHLTARAAVAGIRVHLARVRGEPPEVVDLRGTLRALERLEGRGALARWLVAVGLRLGTGRAGDLAVEAAQIAEAPHPRRAGADAWSARPPPRRAQGPGGLPPPGGGPFRHEGGGGRPPPPPGVGAAPPSPRDGGAHHPPTRGRRWRRPPTPAWAGPVAAALARWAAEKKVMPGAQPARPPTSPTIDCSVPEPMGPRKRIRPPARFTDAMKGCMKSTSCATA